MIADLFSAFCFFFVFLRVVSCIPNVAYVSGCPFMIFAYLVFCSLFLFLDNIEYTRHNTEKKQNKNKAQKTKTATIMVLCTQCCPFMIAEFVFGVLFLFCLFPCCEENKNGNNHERTTLSTQATTQRQRK
jgi:hypothetical protein